MWEPRRLTTLWASTACYRDSFTFLLIFCASKPTAFLASGKRSAEMLTKCRWGPKQGASSRAREGQEGTLNNWSGQRCRRGQCMGHAPRWTTLASVRWVCGWRGRKKGGCKQEPVSGQGRQNPPPAPRNIRDHASSLPSTSEFETIS
jgi:hypothetical protein